MPKSWKGWLILALVVLAGWYVWKNYLAGKVAS